MKIVIIFSSLSFYYNIRAKILLKSGQHLFQKLCINFSVYPIFLFYFRKLTFYSNIFSEITLYSLSSVPLSPISPRVADLSRFLLFLVISLYCCFFLLKQEIYSTIKITLMIKTNVASLIVSLLPQRTDCDMEKQSETSISI
jgi:hypothetical protein